MDNYQWAVAVHEANLPRPPLPECWNCGAEITDESEITCLLCGAIIKEEKEIDDHG